MRVRARTAILAAALAAACACSRDGGEVPAPGAPRGNPQAAREAAERRAAEAAAREAAEAEFAAAESAAADPLAPGERAPVAGLAGLQVTTAVAFEAAPELPHRAISTWVFPGRARFELVNVASPEAGRLREFRFGARHYRSAPAGADGSVESVELEGPEAEAALRRRELRRALLLWPDGFDWTAAGDGLLRATVDGGAGALEATLDAEGRPASIVARDPSGAEEERLAVRSWTATAGRGHPLSFDLAVDGEPVWTETVERFVTDVGFLDVYFLPEDRNRALRPAALGAGVQVGPLLASVRRTVPLDADARDWPLARSEEARLRASAEARGHALADARYFEVDDAGRPIAVVLILADGDSPPPEGWTAQPASDAARVFVQGTEGVTPDAVAALRARVTEGAARPYLRLEDSGPATLVQPLAP